MTRPIIFRREARMEFDEASDWYERQAELGAAFTAAVDQTLQLIALKPSGFPVIHADIRRAIVRRFPYGIFFRLEADRILVIAVFHFRRDPRQWMDRR